MRWHLRTHSARGGTLHPAARVAARSTVTPRLIDHTERISASRRRVCPLGGIGVIQSLPSQSPWNVLLVEDNDRHAEIVRQALIRTGDLKELCRVTRLAEAIECLGSETFDVILADLTLPDSDSMAAVTALCAHVPHTPVVVLIAPVEGPAAMLALERGAQDYVAKDKIDPEILRRSIGCAIQRHRTTRENLRLLRRLKEGKRLLKRKNRRLARLYRTAQQFVDNVSHEFRTPLTVIKEYASLIDEGLVGPVNGEQQRMLNVVIDRSDDLNTMVDDLLDVSKLESGLLCAWRKNCRLEEVVHNVLPGIERKAALQGVRLESDLDPGLADVYCDGDKVARVLINLLVNAVKFSEPQGTVRLWARNHIAGNEVVVGVTDAGPGIAPEHLQRIFDRFEQAGAGARTSTKGVGLGLCIAKELAEINLGAIAVESEVGHGSTFTFTIPMACPMEAAQPARQTAGNSQARHRPGYASLRPGARRTLKRPVQ